MNRLLPIAVLVIFCAAGFIGISVFTGDDESSSAQGASVSNNSGGTPGLSEAEAEANEKAIKIQATVDRDTYVQTIETLTERHKTTLDRVEDLESNMEQRVLEKLSGMLKSEIETGQVSMLDDLSKKIDSTFSQNKKSTKPSTNNTRNNGLPNGLGFDDLPIGGGNSIYPTAKSDYVTITPVSNAVLATDGSEITPSLQKVGLKPDAAKFNKRKANKKEARPSLIPKFTIENLATLFENTTMTALLGIVPKGGKVQDPIKFKVITGKENLATNGLYHEGLENIVWGGYAIGNREMSCVTGKVTKVTYTFSDGTIRTVVDESDDGLGYIADKWGNPCIVGTLYTNAQQYLRDRMIAAGLSTAAEASAATAVTTLQSPDTGTVTSFFSENSSKYILGQTGVGTLNELAAYIRERQADSIEMVHIELGLDVVIHVEKEIAIDYDPLGRKLVHVNDLQKVQSAKLD